MKNILPIIIVVLSFAVISWLGVHYYPNVHEPWDDCPNGAIFHNGLGGMGNANQLYFDRCK
jgi:hypothetical protein